MNEAASPEKPTTWILTDGTSGMEVQCLGLAEALGLDPAVKRIQVTKPWRWLPPMLIPKPLDRLGPKGDRLGPPWPDLLISTGRKTVAPAIAIRRQSAGRTFVVQIQNPAVDLALFDLVIAPEHDRLAGDNVIVTRGALGRVTPARLAAAAEQFEPCFDHLPRPRVAVLIGGNNRAYRLTRGVMTELAGGLTTLTREHGASLMVTPSRRTGAANVALLREKLSGLAAEIWDGEGENPYFGMLALADYIVVTADSVNMVCEAAGTGKPVFVAPLEGGSPKFSRFHQAMQAAGITRPFAGRLEDWRYEPLNETARVADEVARRMARARQVD